MKLGIASDHAGYLLKQALVPFLGELGHEVQDLGCNSQAPVHYPDFADRLCLAMKDCAFERGILVCGTGIGMSMAANRHRYIRAALCHDALGARLSREHNNANVLCLGGRILGTALAMDIVAVWLATEFAGGRHQRRIELFC